MKPRERGVGWTLVVTCTVAAIIATAAPPPAMVPAVATQVRYRLVSVNNRGVPANNITPFGEISRTGRYIVFETPASNMPGVTAEYPAVNVYLRDRRTDRTVLAARASSGRKALGAFYGVISPSGRFVSFCSGDTLVSPDRVPQGTHAEMDAYVDVFVRDRDNGVTRRASTTWSGRMANELSCGGAVADTGDSVFLSRASNLVRNDNNQGTDAFLWDWSRKSIRRLTRGNYTGDITISGNGRYVAVLTQDEIHRGDTNGQGEPYVLDRRTGRWQRPARRLNGGQIRDTCDNGNAFDISYSGRHLVYACEDGHLVDPPRPDGGHYLYLTNLRTGATRLINRGQPSLDTNPFVKGAAVSDDGDSVLWRTEGDGYDGLDGSREFGEDAYLWRRGRGNIGITRGENVTVWLNAFELSGDGRFGLLTSDSPDISNQDRADYQETELYLTTSLR